MVIRTDRKDELNGKIRASLIFRGALIPYCLKLLFQAKSSGGDPCFFFECGGEVVAVRKAAHRSNLGYA